MKGKLLLLAALCVALPVLAGLAPRLVNADVPDPSGTWNVTGRHPSSGEYTGTATLARTGPSRFSIAWNLAFKGGATASLTGEGTLSGSTLETSASSGGPGAIDRLGGVFPSNITVKGRFRMRNGGERLYGAWWTEGGDKKINGSESWRRPPPTAALNLRMDSNGDGKIDALDDPVEEAAPGAMVSVGDQPADRSEARLLGNLPAGGTAKITFEWQGQGGIKVYGPDKKVILAAGAAKADAPATLATADGAALSVEGVSAGEGFLSVRYENGSLKYSNRVRVTVGQEKIYLILWAYLGTEADYQPREFERLKPLFDKIKGLGYTVFDDGTGHDQSKIDAAFDGPDAARTQKKLIIDRATCRADFEKYMKRRSVRGVLWASHGFMQPYPDCPESELLTFESRVWSCPQGDPTSNESKAFVREWWGYVKAQRKLPMNFAIMHSCTTGGLGSDYSDEPWHYCDDPTLARVKKKFGELPPLAKLSFTTFKVMKPQINCLVTYSGSAYFGMYDINLNEVIASIKD